MMKLPMKNYIICLLLLWGLSGSPFLAGERVNPLKLCVTISGENGSGSGFVIRRGKQFYVVTNNHVILECRNPVIKGVNGEMIRFTQVLSGTDRDVAFIPIAPTYFTDALPLEVHDDDIWPNEALTCLGDSEGKGVIVVCSGKFLGLGATSFETDAPFVPGNSGGPILRDKTQKVAGVATYLTPLSNAVWAEGTRFAKARGNAARRFAVRLDNLDWGKLLKMDYAEVLEAHNAMASIAAKEAFSSELVQLYYFAKRGNAETQELLGECYAEVKDYGEAVKWYRKSAEQGNAKAQYNLGCCYDFGEGVE